jgi:hypothetical protein
MQAGSLDVELRLLVPKMPRASWAMRATGIEGMRTIVNRTKSFAQ